MIRSLGRLAVGAAIATATLTVIPMASSQAAGTSKVNVLHGLKPMSGDAAVDVYLGAKDATSWNLGFSNFLYGQNKDLGDVAAGDINVLLCAHAANPLPTIAGCADNSQPAVNSNAGTNLTVPDGKNVTLVAAYGTEPAGRPTVLAFDNDVSCVANATTGRLSAAHAAYAPPVDILVDGTDTFTNVSPGGQGNKDVPPGAYDVAVELTDGTPVISEPDVAVAGAQVTKAFVVGSQGLDANEPFDVLVLTRPLEICPAPTTTTTTTAPPPPAVTPAFTG
jgi:hypothetical protein